MRALLVGSPERATGPSTAGKELTKEQLDDIVTFLGATTGEVDAELVNKPALPPSTDKTLKPDPSGGSPSATSPSRSP